MSEKKYLDVFLAEEDQSDFYTDTAISAFWR
jgi:hypothetical protein